MITTLKPHAEMRMKDRGITETQTHKVLQNPKELISVRYDRLAAYDEIEQRKPVVIYRRKMKTLKLSLRCGWMKGG